MKKYAYLIKLIQSFINKAELKSRKKNIREFVKMKEDTS